MREPGNVCVNLGTREHTPWKHPSLLSLAPFPFLTCQHCLEQPHLRFSPQSGPTPGENAFAVRTECTAENSEAVFFKREDFPTLSRIPHFRRVVLTGGENTFAIRT